jgi:NADH ubiquinone oxidoreductase, 20 Kd subunit
VSSGNRHASTLGHLWGGVPSIEGIALGALPGLPKVAVHWPLIDFECGPEQGADNFIEWWHKADRGELDPFVLVVEGSIPNEAIKDEGYWCGFGNNPATGQPMTTNEWLDRLAPKATAILAAGTCVTYGGIHAMAGNPTGVGGCPNVGGICIACTMPGFPDKFMPFMDEPPRLEGVHDRQHPVRNGDPDAPWLHGQDGRPGAQVAHQGR